MLSDVIELEEPKEIKVPATNVVETHVRFVGNMSTISSIVKLLAYIRHAVKNNLNTDLTVHIGKNVVNTELAFDVNNQEISDYKIQKSIEIN